MYKKNNALYPPPEGRGITAKQVKYLLVRKRSEVNAFKIRYLKMIFVGFICTLGAVCVLHFPHSTNDVLSAPASPNYMGFFEK